MFLGAPAFAEHGPGFLERMYPVGGSYVQTLEAEGEGLLQRFLDKRGPGLHHVAFAVDSIDAALADLEARGVSLIDQQARPGGMGMRIAFLHPSATGGVLVELVEEEEEAGARDG
jgi:methylmalonyl-CoA/ethylmalonyl-CoA epimerase